jgi:hypothetical protein
MAKESDIPEFEENEYEGILGGVIYKNHGNSIVVGMKQLGDDSKSGKLTQFIDIRTYYYSNKEEAWLPTSKGATLPIADLNEFREIIERLEGLIQ